MRNVHVYPGWCKSLVNLERIVFKMSIIKRQKNSTYFQVFPNFYISTVTSRAIVAMSSIQNFLMNTLLRNESEIVQIFIFSYFDQIVISERDFGMEIAPRCAIPIAHVYVYLIFT